MNKIVREHYPTSKLPEDLRPAGWPNETVRVTIEAADMSTRPKSFSEIRREIEEGRRSGKWSTISNDEVEQRIRALRDEWDD
jgi:hypothetical protein